MWNMVLFFFKQKTAYEMRISDWSSDVCSSDLLDGAGGGAGVGERLDARREARQPEGEHPRRGGSRTRNTDERQCGSAGDEGTAGSDEADRKSVGEGKSVSVRVDPGGRRIIKKKSYRRPNIV